MSTRLIITHMELENFKSYAGVQRVGPFHKCFSSIVGPNGSGKSNVIDAMMFVFTKRAKALRQNKLSELIHKSEAHPNLPYARVSVYFSEIVDYTGDQDRFELVPGSEFTITRYAYADNSSEYLVSDKKCTMKDVAALLKSKGIDLDHNRFLILQGEVESIALMKPKAPSEHEDGLLEWLEDIIGTAQYSAPIAEATTKVEQLTEVRAAQVNKTKLAEKEKADLEAAKLEAEDALTQERLVLRLKLARAKLIQNKEETTLAAKTEKYEALAEEYAEAKSAVDEASSELKVVEKDFEAAKSEFEAVTADLDSAKKEFAVFERRDVKYREDLKHLRAQEKKKDAAQRKDEIRLEQEQTSLRQLTEQHTAKQAEIEKLSDKVASEEAKVDKLVGSMGAVLAPLQKKLAKVRAEREPVAENVAQYESQLKQTQAQLESLESGLKKEATETQDLQKRVAEMQEKKKQLTVEEQEAKSAKQAAESKKSQTQKALSSVTAKINEAQDYLSRRAEKQTPKAASALLAALFDAQRKKQLRGIHGRLGDLGSVSSEHDVAVSTACGGSLDYIVVDTSDDAKAAVEYMKKQSLGRATFIMLDKVGEAYARSHGRKSDLPIDAKKGVLRVLDIVSTQERFVPAFYYALGDTLLAPDMDIATAVGIPRGDSKNKRRHRVVTLDGGLVDASGTLSGGGRKMNGLITVKNRDKQQEQRVAEEENDEDAKIKEAEASQNLSRLQQEKASLEDALSQATAALTQADASLSLCVSQLKATDSELSSLSSRLQSVVAQSKKSAKQASMRDDMVSQIAQLSPKLQSELAILKTHDEKVKALEEQLDEHGGVQLQSARFAVSSAKTELAAAEEHSAQLAAQMTAAERAVAKTERALAAAATELADIKAQIEQISTDMKEMEAAAFAVMTRVTAVQQQCAGLAEQVQAKEKVYSKARKAFDKIRAGIVDIEEKELEARKALEEARAVIAKYQHETTFYGKKLADAVAAHRSLGADVPESELTELPEALLAPVNRESMAEINDRILTAEADAKSKNTKANAKAIASYKTKADEHAACLVQLEKASEARRNAVTELDQLQKRRLDEFSAGFSEISMKLKEMYQMITLGGDAELEWVDSLDPFSEGVVFSVRPPKKTWKQIRNLSGGEKTLASLALVFALHHYKPTPLYVMDEIDAALDFRNVSIVANYIKERTKDAQFVIISLRNNMFELADRLVGVYKTDNQTKTVTVNPRAFASRNQA